MKKEVSSAISSLQNAIAATDEASELKKLQRKFEKLTQTAKAKLSDIEEAAKKKGFEYEGKGAIECSCGNTVDPEGDYAFECTFCDSIKCSDCSSGCDICGEAQCDICSSYCDLCEKSYCQECSFECDQCCNQRCSDCVKSVGYAQHEVCTLCADDILCPSRY